MSSYQYKCQDDSILLPFLKKNVFSVLHRYIPYGIPANYLTLISIFVVWSCFIYFINLDTPENVDNIIAIFSIIIYVIFDHFDGLQAKKTKTGSPLGEILDHFSDVLNGSIILYLVFRILKIELDWLFFLVIWVNLIAFSITYLEQSIRRKLHFGKIGSLEGVVLILLILCTFLTNQGKTFWLESSIMGLPVYAFLILVLILGVIYTVFTSLKRLRHIPKSFIRYLLTGFILYCFCINNQISWYLNFFVINIFSADFILQSMKSHLLDNNLPETDVIIYLFFFFLMFDSLIEYEKQIIFLCYGIIITGKILWNFIKIFSEFKHYWIWWNFR